MSDTMRPDKLAALHDAVQRWTLAIRGRAASRQVVEEYDRRLVVITHPWPEHLVAERREAVARLMWWGEEEKRRLAIMQEVALAATEREDG